MGHPWSSDPAAHAAIRRAEPDTGPALTHAEVPRAVERLAERVARLEAVAAMDGGDEVARLTAERDAAIRERDKLRSDMAFNCDLSSLAASETEKLRARVRELEAAGEPVLYGVHWEGRGRIESWDVRDTEEQANRLAGTDGTVVPLYAAPPQERVVRLPEWVGLPNVADIRESLTAAGVRWEVEE